MNILRNKTYNNIRNRQTNKIHKRKSVTYYDIINQFTINYEQLKKYE